MRKKIICLILCLIQLVTVLSGCTVDENAEGKPVKTTESYVSSGTVAQDGELRLDWDADRMALLIYKGDELIWSSMPKEQYLNNLYDGGIKSYLESSLVIEGKRVNEDGLTTVTSYMGAYEYGRTYSYKIDNGIRLLYCFDEQNAAIPVEYRLINGYLDVNIKLDSIYESQYQIYRISVLPYASSVLNEKVNEMFIPDGSGMVMYCDTDRAVRNYKGYVYGKDRASTTQYQFTKTENVKLPIYAVSDAEATYCTIIDKGEECAEINATAGDKDLGFSYAHTTFAVRGTEAIVLPQGWGEVMIGHQLSKLAKGSKIGQRIIFIDGQDTDFFKTAQVYREYLVNEKGLKKQENETALYLDLPMAASKREFFFGMPKKVVKPITTYAQAAEIIADVAKETGISPAVKLSGVQGGGLDATKIAGGYKTEKVLGDKKSLAKLLDVTKKNGTKLFPEFDLIRFTKSANGFRVNTDAATSTTSLKASQFFYSVSTGGLKANAYEYYLLAPNFFKEAVEKLTKTLKKSDFSGVSLGEMGNITYGDYRRMENYVALSFSENVTKAAKVLKKNKTEIMFDSANQYAALNADYIMDSPINSSNFAVEDEWLPFYHIVFKGYRAMSGTSLTLSNNETDDFLRSVALGTGLQFTVCGTQTSEYSASVFDILSAGSYEDRKETMLATIKRGKDAIEATNGATKNGYAVLAYGVYKTTFSNGVEITINCNETDYNAEGISIGANDFIIKR